MPENSRSGTVDEARELLRLALTVFPDSKRPLAEEEYDVCWSWAWTELSGEAQEEIKKVRGKIEKFLGGK